jgi:hypothetical protein
MQREQSVRALEFSEEQVNNWKNELFEGQSLRVGVKELDGWPLQSYLLAAAFQARHLCDERTYAEVWKTPAWDFGRFARAHPTLFHLDERAALNFVRAVLGTNFWQDILSMDQGEAEIAFDDVWVTCRTIPGHDPLAVAVSEGKRLPYPCEPDTPAAYATFLGIARSLKRQQGDKPFLLPCHKLADILGCSPMMITRLRRKAERDGFLEVVKKHSYRGREATEFRFLGTAPERPDDIILTP